MEKRLSKSLPEMLKHEGVWAGTYTHLDIGGNVIDTYKSRIECIFPEEGEAVYIQKNSYTWDDGRVVNTTFDGILLDDKIYWDTETFQGYGWESGNCVLLTLDRKDDPGASFTEIIIIGEDNNHRVRTWHWFKHGKCFQRTLCNEIRVS